MRCSGEAATPRDEAAQMKRDGYEPILTKSRWCLLKRRESLADNQEVKLKQLLSAQPQERPGSSAQGTVPEVLGLREPGLG